MQGDDPPFLPVGTDVSAKYKGAFCEAKIKKVVRNIKCKVTLKTGGGSMTVNDDAIKGTLRVGSAVEVKPDPKKEAVEGVIAKIQDCSQYTVVFDDGDITTLRRTALCLKSGRHFNESETLDQLPLTHPEHFSTPVIAGRRGRRGRAQSDESEGDPIPDTRGPKPDREPHVGRVVLVESASGAERRRPHQPAFPALVVAPTPQINVKEDYLVRSFKDGRYYTVPKKEAREFRKGSAPLEWTGVDAALQYLNNRVLPPHWDRDALFNDTRNTSDDSSDDEPREEKDHFVAQLYKFMDDRGTPLNRNPTIANRDIDLYRLFRVVQKLGGYNRVTNQNQWKIVADKMGFHPVTASITNLCKQAYKKFLHSFEDFYRKLGVTLVAHPRGARTPPAGRSLIREREKQPPTSSSASSTPTGTPVQRGKDSDSAKSETEKSDKSEKDDKIDKPKAKVRGSDEEDSADNVPLMSTIPKIEKEKKEEKERAEMKQKEREKEKEKEKEKERDLQKEKDKERQKAKEKETQEKDKPKPGPSAQKEKEKTIIKPRSQSKTRSLPIIKTEHEKRLPKRRPLSSKSESPSTSLSRVSQRPHVSTDSDSSGRASRFSMRCSMTKKMASRRSQSANSASSGNTIASNSSKRPRKRKTTEPSTSELPIRGKLPTSNVKAQVGDKLKVYYGPAQSISKVTYEAKVTEIAKDGTLRVHYTGWNTRYDEWINPQRIALNVTQHEQKNKKLRNSSISRRARVKRTEESSAISDTDSDSDKDSDSEDDAKLPPKSLDDKCMARTRSKDAAKSSDSSSSSKPRKRPIRTISTSSSTSPVKKTRVTIPNHPGRDYDLNEIRSELKGLHTVKQEPEDVTIKHEPLDNELPSTSKALPPVKEPVKPQQDKQPEDVYEFKEPEPFELELHDDKKKRTHRIFDDISPRKYTSTLNKSLSEEIAEDPLRPNPSLRSPAMSPFREFATKEAERKSVDDESKDDVFSMDEDSFQDGLGAIFEGFTPAKNQETYSKRNKSSKLRELIDDSPDSPADDEQSSEDEELIMKDLEEMIPSPVLLTEKTKSTEMPKTPEQPKEVKDKPKPKDEPPKSLKETKMDVDMTKDNPKAIDVIKPSEPPKTPPRQKKLEAKKTDVSISKKLEQPSTSITKKIDISNPSSSKKNNMPTTSVSTKSDSPNAKKVEIVGKSSKKTETASSSKNPDPPATSKPLEQPSATSNIKETPILSKKLDISSPTQKSNPVTTTIKKTELPTSTPKKVDVPTTSINKNSDSPPTSKKADSPPNSKKTDIPEITKKLELPSTSITVPTSVAIAETKLKENENPDKDEIKYLPLQTPATEPKESTLKLKLGKKGEPADKKVESVKKLDPFGKKSEPFVRKMDHVKKLDPVKKMDTVKKLDPIVESLDSKTKLEMPSSPLDTEEDKSEPDSPARIDVIPEPPPGFLLQSEGPKIAEKLLKAINSAKRLSMSPPPSENRPKTPKKDDLKITKPEGKLSLSPVPKDTKKSPPLTKLEPKSAVKKQSPIPPKQTDAIFGEPSNISDAKPDIKKVKPKVPTPPPRLQSPLNILERRPSVADLPTNKNNKVLSDTIQKLSSQINQSAANIPLPPFPTEDKSESSDSDESNQRRLIIDKLSVGEWAATTGPSAEVTRTSGAGVTTTRALHAGKSPGEWSAGETLLMLEDACKNERKHSSSVVVAGRVCSSGAAPTTETEDSNISLLLCSETIPGSPAPDAAVAEPAPPKQRLHMPFACAPPHHQHKAEERRGDNTRESGTTDGEAAAPHWTRHGDNTPNSTPGSSPARHRDRHISERDSPSVHKEEEEDSRTNDVDMDKSHGARSRKASESSGMGSGRGRRRMRRDTDDTLHPPPPLKYNFYVELDPTWDCPKRINILQSRLADLRKAYHSLKGELAAIDRRRKKLRRKEREAVKAAKAACS